MRTFVALCALSGVAACGTGTKTAALGGHPARPGPPSPTRDAGICGIRVGYVPAGLRLRSVEGSPGHDSVDIRYMGAAGMTAPTDPWLFVGIHWGAVDPISRLTRYYPGSTLTVVRGKPALFARTPPRMLLQWNESPRLSASVETTTLSRRQLRRVAEGLRIPAEVPADAPGPPEAGPTGCAVRG